MALGLKLTSAPIRWSLAVKAAIFGAAWFFLPLWFFLLLAAYFYFRPFFQPARLLAPFLVLLYFAAAEPRSVWLAIIFSALFYLVIGIKDFHIIDRRSVHEVLVLLLTFLVLEKFYSKVSGWDSAWSTLGALGIGAAVFLFGKEVFARNSLPSGGTSPDSVGIKKKNIALLVLALASFELILGALFLPISFLYQAAIALVGVTVFFEVTADFLSGRLERKRVLSDVLVGLVFLVVILGAAPWTL